MQINDLGQLTSLVLWHTTGADVFQVPGAIIARTGMKEPYLNKIVVTEPLCKERIKELAAHPKLSGISYSWMISEKYHTDEVEKLLASCGFCPNTAMTTMEYDLVNSDTVVDDHQVVRSLSITPMLSFWNECFTFSENGAKCYYEFMRNHFQGSDLCQYFAYSDDEPAGCGWLLVHNDLAGLFYIGTKLHARNSGVGTNMVRTLLRQAKKRGCRKAALIALPMAKSLYKRVGFMEYEKYTLFTPS